MHYPVREPPVQVALQVLAQPLSMQILLAGEKDRPRQVDEQHGHHEYVKGAKVVDVPL